MLISALAFALMAALVKEAGQQGIPLLQIIFVRALISVALSLIDIGRAGVHPLGHRRVLLFARGAFRVPCADRCFLCADSPLYGSGHGLAVFTSRVHRAVGVPFLG